MKGIYVASKLRHLEMWKKFRNEGYPIISTWLDEPTCDKSHPDLDKWWERYVSEANNARVLTLYVEPNDVMKGALIEVGAALAGGAVVLVVGPVEGSWVRHPLVTQFDSLQEMMNTARLLCLDPTSEPV